MSFCSKCGCEISDTADFCSKCGTPTKEQNEIRYVEAEILQDSPKKVNQIAYVLFAILLGELGIHKFYEGKVIKGVIYLLLCWTFIPGLLGIIEGILALTKKADKDGNIVP